MAALAQDPAFDAARSTGIDADLEHDAAELAAKAKVSIEEFALRAATRIFDVGGASAVRVSAHFDQHWRNLRTLFSHNPTVYKARAPGDLLANEQPFPAAGRTSGRSAISDGRVWRRARNRLCARTPWITEIDRGFD
ncbi:hypothetical protein ACWEO2_26325 [Nocardia sp. NPDC004278]